MKNDNGDYDFRLASGILFLLGITSTVTGAFLLGAVPGMITLGGAMIVLSWMLSDKSE